ncbi:guanitoxin biosynthesis L-arginine gamma (S) hydroxylase [Burkholderia thailandensis]|uniref:guanitoxin biosynthesis L-arginine gamma (S) hydroxylase n=1 Tax=Burkholderia thailandensis TaxID=57975 RepID=UPI000517B7CB|nr:guanitoxin biosynthesis L-arginine gamma (S) hydroxylase [Burkholderia thailandensis]AIT21304.1 fatty acid desaturase family protein [Burkholderia thailandensis E254]MBS2127780.1 fatty acid desaturase family protein [Burkholderia thailandensis]MCS6474927.1 fatty acid desaturase family protein [Burkholderia thailandensis]MCS6517822.1 fatty acid desaturase family protein [Burkholderia thailandensis]NOK39954.1 fatty acid desaturase [Burkholderia thailandensis]
MIEKHVFSKEIRERLRPLFTLNNWRGPLELAGDYLCIAAAVYATYWSMWCYPLSLLVIGSRQRALASLLHESCHKTFMRNRALNDLFGRWLAGYPIFQSHRAYVKSHVLDHHTFLGDARRDPDYIHYIESGLFDVRDRLDFVTRFIVKTILLLNVAGYLRYLLMNRLGEISREKKELAQLVLTQAAIFAAFYVAVGPLGYVVFWIVPIITTFQVIGWFSEISEHYPVIRTTRSTLTITRNRFPVLIERAFVGMHGDNYHLVHHLLAGIPFWNLRRAHAILMEDPAYAAANRALGGIFTAPSGRISVMRSILDEIRVSAPLDAPVASRQGA